MASPTVTRSAACSEPGERIQYLPISRRRSVSSFMARVLIVEDDDAIRRLIVGALQQEGYAVAIASDGASGLEAFERERPDVIVLDLRLPVIHGFVVRRRVSKPSAWAVLVLTG